MTTTALLLALAAAVVHAVWNVLLARARDPQAATAVALLTAEVVFAVPALPRVAHGLGRLAVHHRERRASARLLRAPRDRIPAAAAVRGLSGLAGGRAGARARDRHRRARSRDLGRPGARGLPRRSRDPARPRPAPTRRRRRRVRARDRVRDRDVHARRQARRHACRRAVLPRDLDARAGAPLRRRTSRAPRGCRALRAEVSRSTHRRRRSPRSVRTAWCCSRCSGPRRRPSPPCARRASS